MDFRKIINDILKENEGIKSPKFEKERVQYRRTVQ